MNVLFIFLFTCILCKTCLLLSGETIWFKDKPTVLYTSRDPIPHCTNQPIVSCFISRKTSKKYFYYSLNKNHKCLFSVIRLLILLSGDVHPNPGPSDQSNRVYTSTPDDSVFSFFQNPLSLKIASINFQSIVNKFAQLDSFLHSYQFDIILGSETHLDPSISNPEIFPSNYNVIRKDRNRHGGGVLIAVSNLFQIEKIDIQDNTESLFVKILSKDCTHIIISHYRPPGQGIDYTRRFTNSLSNIFSRYPDSRFILGGDFNLPHVDWTSHSVLPENPYKQISRLFLDKLSDLGLHQIINEPTRTTDHSSTILDLLITNHVDLISFSGVLPGFSDHDIPFSIHNYSIPKNDPPPRKRYLYHKADWPAIKSNLLNFQNQYFSLHKDNDIHTKWNLFKNTILNLIDQHIPFKFQKSYHKPWHTSSIKRLIRKKQRLYNKAKKTKSPIDQQIFRDFRRELDKTINDNYRRYISNMVDSDSNKLLYKHVKNLRKDQTSIPTLRHDASVATSDAEKANLLNEYFSSLFNSSDAISFPAPNISNIPPMPEITLGLNGIIKLCDNLKAHSAAGPDCIPSKFLKFNSVLVSPILLDIFSTSLRTSIIPSDWLSAHVVPIFKKGSRSSPNNYRPISLTSIVSKIFEHILYSQIATHLDKNNFFNPAQHGFLKGRSCQSQLLLTVNDYANVINRAGQTDAIVLDFSKAFDSVPHQGLFAKLSCMNLHTSTLSWIKSFLSHRTQKVVVNGCHSSVSPVVSGVPQGSVLGPLLFLIYINDLPRTVVSTVRLFADDCLIYREIKNPQDHTILQNDLLALEGWSSTWRLKFNVKKCQFMSITNKTKPSLSTYRLNNVNLDRVFEFVYLGVTISSKLSWTSHIEYISLKAKRCIHFLQRNLKGASVSSRLKAYIGYVRPILEYSSCVWNPDLACNIDALDSVQRLGIRFIRNDYRRRSSVTQMAQGLNLEPLATRRLTSDLVMVFKIVKNEIFIQPNKLLSFNTSSITRGHTYKLYKPYCRINAFRSSFAYRIISHWNSLQQDLLDSTNSNHFSRSLSKLY